VLLLEGAAQADELLADGVRVRALVDALLGVRGDAGAVERVLSVDGDVADQTEQVLRLLGVEAPRRRRAVVAADGHEVVEGGG
jgi:hypothetical protein